MKSFWERVVGPPTPVAPVAPEVGVTAVSSSPQLRISRTTTTKMPARMLSATRRLR